jgi:hypothetical protein
VNDIQNLLRKIVLADRLVWEDQLELNWRCPSDLAILLKDVRPTKEMTSAPFASGSRGSIERDQLKELLTSDSTRQLLMVLVDEVGSLLVDNRLQKLLDSLTQEEQFLVRIDCIFHALGIESVQDVADLESFFADHQHQVQSDRSTETELVVRREYVMETLKRFVTSRQSNRTKAGTSLEDAKHLSTAHNTLWDRLIDFTAADQFKSWKVMRIICIHCSRMSQYQI